METYDGTDERGCLGGEGGRRAGGVSRNLAPQEMADMAPGTTDNSLMFNNTTYDGGNLKSGSGNHDYDGDNGGMIGARDDGGFVGVMGTQFVHSTGKNADSMELDVSPPFSWEGGVEPFYGSVFGGSGERTAEDAEIMPFEHEGSGVLEKEISVQFGDRVEPVAGTGAETMGGGTSGASGATGSTGSAGGLEYHRQSDPSMDSYEDFGHDIRDGDKFTAMGAKGGWKSGIDHDNINNFSNFNNNFNNNFNPGVSNNNTFHSLLMVNELSPTTTTTSFTHSTNSVHSTQPSFFSAQQFLHPTPSDQPPSLLQRQSFDYFSRNKASFDSQRSSLSHGLRSQPIGRYTSFTNSISNYIPFMSDRNERSSGNSTPVSGSPSPSSPLLSSVFPNFTNRPTLSRQLIKGIFHSSTQSNLTGKARSNGPQVENNPQDKSLPLDLDGLNDNEDINVNSNKEIPDNEHMDSAFTSRKAKRSKRSLFTRFKTTVKSEPNEETGDTLKTDDTNAIFENKGSLKESEFEMPEKGVSAQPSLHDDEDGSTTGVTPSTASRIEPSSSYPQLSLSANTSPQQLMEPDYAALFQKVGKRRNIVNPASYIKTKPKYKGDQSELTSMNGSGGSNSQPNTEKSSVADISATSSISDISKVDSNAKGDISSAPEMTGGSSDDYLQQNFGHANALSSLATASKRILGSKLMLKKKVASQSNIPINPATMIDSNGVEVEVDLKSLDLPPNTQIYPTSIINSKSRTRGRKENKEADLVDRSKIYLCNYCSRRFKRQEHLKRHFRSLHTFEKPYDCPICLKKFSRSDNLNQHLKVHKQEEQENG